MDKRNLISESKYLKLAETSSHFNYFFHESFKEKKRVFNDIKNTLEKNYKRLLKIFKLEEYPIFPIYIYHDLKYLHKECYNKKMPNWVTAGGGAGYIATIDPSLKQNKKSYKILMSDLSHELVHTISLFHIPMQTNIEKYYLPNWFVEGLAVYYSNEDKEEEKIITYLKEHGPPPLSNFEKISQIEFAENYGYYFSPTIIEFIIKTYGKQKILEILKDYKKSIYSIIGDKKKNFEQNWHNFLEKKFMRNENRKLNS